MKEKGSGFGGFILCFLTSLLYHAGWALAAVLVTGRELTIRAERENGEACSYKKQL